jgi:hypothetical protein
MSISIYVLVPCNQNKNHSNIEPKQTSSSKALLLHYKITGKMYENKKKTIYYLQL